MPLNAATHSWFDCEVDREFDNFGGQNLMAQDLNAKAATLEQELPIVIDQARDACAVNGALSSECAAAWDIVEEIQSTISHRKADQRNSLQRYCDDRPDASECRIYDV